MGVDFCATAVVGVRVAKGDLFESIRVKSFDHDYPEDWTVDPKSGRKLWHYEDRCVLGEDFVWKGHGDISSFTEGMNDDYLYIGFGASTNSHRGRDCGSVKLDFNLSLVEDHKTELKEFLGDLFNENDFGVWAVPYVSC